MATQTALPPQTASGTTTQAMPPVTNPQTPSSGGASGSWGPPTPTPVVPPTAKPQTPPAVVTAKPAVQAVQKQKEAITEKTYSAQAQQQSNAAALAAKNAADAAKAATGGLTPEQNAVKIKEMQASAVAQSSQAVKKTETPTSTSPAPQIPVAADQTPEQKVTASIQASDTRMQTAYDEHKAKIDQIINGTYPLTDDQKSQLNNIAVQFQGMIKSQKLANTNYEQALRVGGISSGRSMYAPEIELGNIKGAMDDGLAKIADIDMKMQTTLINARQAIKDDNVKLLSSAYKDLVDFESAKRKSINDLYAISTKEIENARQSYKDAQKEAESYAALSKSPDSFSPDFFAKMDKQREQVGLPSYTGYSADIYKLEYEQAKKTKDLEDTAAQTKQAMDLINLFDKAGIKGDIKIGENKYSYQGTNLANVASGTETDSKGNLMAWTLDKTTGATKTYSLGIKTGDKATTIKGEDGLYYSYDPATKTATPIFVSDGRSAWDEGALATGQTGPALPGHEANAGQCGALVNAMYGKGVIGNDLKTGKLDVLEPYKVEFSPTNAGNIQAGMTFVQAIGGKNGHIGFVESVGKDPVSGRAFITTFDSNRNSDGKIQHGKQIYLDDPTLKMIADHPAPNLPAFGPDAPPKQLGAGTISVKDKEELTPPEAKALGVPYGTTRGQAKLMGIIPTDQASDKPLSGDAAKLKSITESIEPEIDALIAAFEKDYKGSLTGILTGKNRTLAKLMDQVADKVGRLRSGGAINKDEAASFKKQVASFMDIPFGEKQGAIDSLNSLKAEAKIVRDGIVKDGKKTDQTEKETPSLPALPSNYSDQLKAARAAKGPDSDAASLDKLLKHFPAYQSVVDAAKANNLTPTEILDSLAK